MVDVPRIPGTGGSADPAGGKGTPRTDAEKFKELMQVGDTDADQRKKKKQQQEAMEEKKAAARTESVAASQDKEKALELHKFKKTDKIEKPGESEKKQKQQQKRPEEPPPSVEKQGEKARRASASSATVPSTTKSDRQPPSHRPLPEPATVDLPPPPAPLRPIEPIPEPAPEPEKAPPAAKQKAVQEKTPEGAAPPPTAPGPFFLPAASEVPPAYTQLSAEAFALFEKLVSAIMVMQEAGITETVIHLSSSEFTLFAGAQIVIREYTTAPKAFNIEFQGNAQNVALFEKNVADLMAAFQYGNYNFKIHRMESSLLASDKPLFHRKEGAADKEKDQKGGSK